MHTGAVDVRSQGNSLCWSDLFPLSPQTIEQYLPQTKLKTVYIPHPDRANLRSSMSKNRPYTTIKLVLLGKTRDTLRSRGYRANLRDPDPDHPTTHRLTLSNGKHTIIVEFRHTLGNGGRRFTIDAEVQMSSLDFNHIDRCIVSWSDPGLPWFTTLRYESVRLNAAGAGPLTVDLRLDLTGTGVYILHVDVFSDPSPTSAVVE